MTLLDPTAPLLRPKVAPRPRARCPLLDERRTLIEARALLCHPVWRGKAVPRGDGLPVLLVPGFKAGDVALRFLSRWLGRMGYVSYRSKVQVTGECPGAILDRLERRLEFIAERAQRPVAVIGQDRGGLLAKGVAIRRADLVAGVVSLGSPHCASPAWAAPQQPFPDGVPFTSIYSRIDGVVDWRACLDPMAEQVEVPSSHHGMAVHPAVYRVLGERLAAMGARSAGSPPARVRSAGSPRARRQPVSPTAAAS